MPIRSEQIQWRRVVADGIAIVLSILVAFAIDAWWDGQVDRREEIESLSAVRADFEATIVELERAGEVHRFRLGAARFLLSATTAELHALPADSMQALLQQTLLTTTIDPPAAALTSMIASGQLSLISDKAMRNRLAAWTGLLEDHRGTQALLLTEITAGYDPWLRSRTLIERRDQGSLRFEPDFDSLLGDFRFDNELIKVAERTAVVIGELEALVEEAQRVLDMLDSLLPAGS